jgi:hypothetical protein
MMPLLWGHYSEEWRRHYGIPQEFEERKVEGKTKAFEVRHKGKKMTGMYVESDSQSMAGWLRSKMGPYVDVAVIKNSKGYVSILTKQVKRIDLRLPIVFLREKELAVKGLTPPQDQNLLSHIGRIEGVPEWYYDTATNSILNGTANSETIPPTSIDSETIISLLKRGLNEFGA